VHSIRHIMQSLLCLHSCAVVYQHQTTQAHAIAKHIPQHRRFCVSRNACFRTLSASPFLILQVFVEPTGFWRVCCKAMHRMVHPRHQRTAAVIAAVAVASTALAVAVLGCTHELSSSSSRSSISSRIEVLRRVAAVVVLAGGRQLLLLESFR
jgi:hypothetical protein